MKIFNLFLFFSFSYKILATHLTLHFYICNFFFYTMNKVLNDNIIFFVIIVITLRVCLDRTYFAETENLLLKSL